MTREQIEERIAKIAAMVFGPVYAPPEDLRIAAAFLLERLRESREQLAEARKDAARINRLAAWLRVDPNRRFLTWDKSGREFTLFRNDEDQPRLGMSVSLRVALDDAALAPLSETPT